MTNYGPWSVKGIDQRAREAAREAAREEGLTIGEYINRMLLEETGGEAPSARDDNSPRYPRPEPQPHDFARAQAPMGPANDMIRDLVARVEAVETRSSLALSGIDRSILDLTQRLDDTRRQSSGKASDIDAVLSDLRSTHEALRDKVRVLEDDKTKPGNLQALKSLERALGKLANHVYQESSTQKDQAAALRSRVETGLEDMGKRLSGMEGQIDGRLSEAEGRLARTVEQAEARTEGATRHLSSRFTDLETNLTSKLARVDGFSERVEKVETGLAQKASAVDTRLTELRARLERAETATDAALVKLEKTFGALNERVEELASTALPEAAKALREQFDTRFEGLASELRTSIETTRREIAAEIEDVSGRSATTGQLDELRDDMRTDRVAADQRLEKTRDELTSAIGKVSEEAVRPEDISRLSEAVGSLKSYIDSQKDASERRLEEARKQLAGQIEHVASRAVSPDTVTGVQASLSSLRDQLAKNEESAGRTLERVTEQITRISTGLSRRIKQVEDKDCMREVEELRGRLDQLSGDVASQLEKSGSQTDAVIERISAEMREMAERFDTRIDESEKRSASAIEQVGEQVSGVANRLQSRQERAFRDLEQTIETERKQQQKRLSDALNGVSDRIGKMQEESRTSLSPVQKAIASLATRLETFEDTGTAKPAKDGESETRRADLNDFLSDEPLPKREARKESPAKAAPKARKEQDFDGELPFLEDFGDDAPPVDAAGMYDYETELPDDDGGDELSSLSSWDEADEAWDDGASADHGDAAFAGERPAADESWGLGAGEGTRRQPNISAGNDYLSRARLAALEASETQPVKSKKAAKPSKKAAKPAKQAKPAKTSKSKLPLVAAVSVVALATAAAGALFALRGMQEDSPRPSVQTRDTISLAAVDTAGEADIAPEDLGEEDLGLGEPTGDTPADDLTAAPSETVNSMQAPADTTDEDADLFEEDTATAETQAAASPLAGLDPIPAIPTLQAAADSGNAEAQFMLGQQRLDAGDYTNGPTLIRRAAEQDLPAAQYRLAKLHEKGLGVPRDLAMARQWTERAARGGNVKAMHDLAVYYAQGDGGPASEATAAAWFRRAADYGVADSQFNLALFYETGSGLPEDLTEALFWYTVAANGGDAQARGKVDELTGLVSPQEAASAKQQAARWSPTPRDEAANGNFAPQAWQGQSTAQVEAVQTTLAAMGYEPGPADGLMGTGTIDAITAYQGDNGLDQTGRITPALIESLNTAIRDARS